VSNRECIKNTSPDTSSIFMNKILPGYLIFINKGGCYSSCTSSMTVISGGDRTRMGGPQVPVPLLTYIFVPSSIVYRPQR